MTVFAACLMTLVHYLQGELQVASLAVSIIAIQSNPSAEIIKPVCPGLLPFFTSLFANKLQHIPAVVHRRQHSSSERRGKPEVTFNIPSE